MTKAGSWAGRAPGCGAGIRDHEAAHTPGLQGHETVSRTHAFPCSSAGSGELCAQGSPLQDLLHT
eukprot:431975-Amphidinium_carterae.1